MSEDGKSRGSDGGREREEVKEEARKRRRTSGGSDQIPKIIHQIWVGPKPLPESCKRWSETWKEKHPEWEYRLWDNEAAERFLPRMRNADYYRQAIVPAMKADILRLEILYEYGGFYVDMDMECLWPMDELIEHPGIKFIAGAQEDYSTITNTLIGATPKHDLINAFIEAVTKRRKFEGWGILKRTGPGMITDVLAQQNAYIRPDICIMGPESFYPSLVRAPLSNAFCTHHAMKSWTLKAEAGGSGDRHRRGEAERRAEKTERSRASTERSKSEDKDRGTSRSEEKERSDREGDESDSSKK